MPISEEAIVQIVSTVIPAVLGSGAFLVIGAIALNVFSKRRRLPKETMQAIIDLNDRVRHLERQVELQEDQMQELLEENRYLKGPAGDDS